MTYEKTVINQCIVFNISHVLLFACNCYLNYVHMYNVYTSPFLDEIKKNITWDGTHVEVKYIHDLFHVKLNHKNFTPEFSLLLQDIHLLSCQTTYPESLMTSMAFEGTLFFSSAHCHGIRYISFSSATTILFYFVDGTWIHSHGKAAHRWHATLTCHNKAHILRSFTGICMYGSPINNKLSIQCMLS